MNRLRAKKTPCPHGERLKHQCKACKTDFNRNYRAANSEKFKAYDKEYRKKYYSENRIYHLVAMMNLRAKKYGVEGFITVEVYESLINNPCSYCGLTILPMELDHRVPMSQGGSNWPENLQAACRYCNRSKAYYGEEEFLAWLHMVKAS